MNTFTVTSTNDPIEAKATKLLYMSDMNMYTCQARIVGIQEREDGKTELYLDQTIFYPQGGGQPWDTGTIEILKSINPDMVSATYNVVEVRYIDGRVMHLIDSRQSAISIGDMVRCTVDIEKRILHSRLHSAGHLIDMALKEMGLDWRPTKGYHFPNGPYVEYEVSTLPADLESIRIQLEQICSDIIGQGIQTSITFEGGDSKGFESESGENGKTSTGKSGPGGKPLRTVWYGDFGIQCGGTHVAKLGDIGICRIRKIKKEGNGLRVGYQVE